MPKKYRSQFMLPICMLLMLPAIAGTVPFRTLNTVRPVQWRVLHILITNSHTFAARSDRLFSSPYRTSESTLFTAKQKLNVFYIIFTQTCSFKVLISFYSIVANYLDVTSRRLVCQKHARSAAGAVLIRPYTAGRITQLLEQIRT